MLLPCDSTIQVWCKVLSEDTSKGCKCVNELAVVPPKHCSQRPCGSRLQRRAVQGTRSSNAGIATWIQAKAQAGQSITQVVPKVRLQGPDDSGSGDESTGKAKHED